MCRNIRTLANFDPPATDDEIRASALQFVRKLCGSTKPSRANEAAFHQAVDDVTAAAERLVRSFTTTAPTIGFGAACPHPFFARVSARRMNPASRSSARSEATLIESSA